MPMMEMFDRGITLRMGQCHVKRWVDELLPLVLDSSDPLGTEHSRPCYPVRGAGGLPDVPDEGRRLHQGDPPTLTAAEPARNIARPPSPPGELAVLLSTAQPRQVRPGELAVRQPKRLMGLTMSA